MLLLLVTNVVQTPFCANQPKWPTVPAGAFSNDQATFPNSNTANNGGMAYFQIGKLCAKKGLAR